MWKKVFVFFLGVAMAPYVKQALKPLSRQAVKGALLLNEELKRTIAEVREDLEDITAEAVAEMDTSAASTARHREH